MNNVICSLLDIIHVDAIESMDVDQEGFSVQLKPGKNFISLSLEGNATYNRQSSADNPGISFTDTVTAKMKISDALFLIVSPLRYYVLKLYTTTGSFIVGSLEYPAEWTSSTDNIFVNLTFKAIKPV